MLAPRRISIVWVLLDIVGVALVGLGLAENINKLHLFPESMRFPGLGWLLMAVGLLCIFPLYWQILKAVKAVKQQDELLFKNLPDKYSSKK